MNDIRHKSRLVTFILSAVLSMPFPVMVYGAPDGGDLRLKTVVIDPGHGGRDPGCISRDGKVYGTVTLGDQVWMSENLAYMPEGEQDTDISWDEPRYYVWGDYLLDSESEVEREMARASLEAYGVFYNWWAAMDGDPAPAEGASARGICPEGWHIPSAAEWDGLVTYLSESGFSSSEEDPLGRQLTL